MGCLWTKTKKSAYERVAQYQTESCAAERSLRCTPAPLEWEHFSEGCVTPMTLHNYLTDGFYAPFIMNPKYILLIDCRRLEAFLHQRLATAQWCGNITDTIIKQNHVLVVIYDEQNRLCHPSPEEDSAFSNMFFRLKQLMISPKIVLGGWNGIQKDCGHLLVNKNHDKKEFTWYPTMIVPDFLYLGQSDIASDAKILTELRITHIITISDTVPRRVLLSTNFLVVPLFDNGKQIKNGPQLSTCYSTLCEFVREAKSVGGSVLVHSEEGMASAAAVTMALMMSEGQCTLEDAFYYVQSARSSITPKPCLLDQLMALEKIIFGVHLTSTEELF